AYVRYLTERPVPQPAVNHPYDSSAYVRYLTERPALAWSLEYGPRFNPGTGTVYDGKSYEQRALAVNPNVPNIGTGSAYDGNDYSGVTALPWSLEYGPRFNPGTGTVYDGKPYAQPVPAVKPNVPIDGTGSAYDGQ
ncbi:MAG TPA: hypothetical protein VFO07_11135, partial [Roseiflexaceae bacterium]|nr:hypothetical protein [Roseiflexaceae bacterium]